MTPNKAKAPITVRSGDGALGNVVAGQRDNSENNPSPTVLQQQWLAAHYGLSSVRAGVIADLHFGAAR